MVVGLVFQKKHVKELKEILKSFNRHALHSKKLSLIHPVSGQSMTWKIDLPPDMKELLNVLTNYDS
jgi:23S rRNA pseudouridine1911/1915/1917 synthase